MHRNQKGRFDDDGGVKGRVEECGNSWCTTVTTKRGINHESKARLRKRREERNKDTVVLGQF